MFLLKFQPSHLCFGSFTSNCLLKLYGWITYTFYFLCGAFLSWSSSFLTEDKPLCYLDIPCVSFNSFHHRLLVPLFFFLCDLPVKQVSCLWSHIFLPCSPMDVKIPYRKGRSTETAQVKPPEHEALQGWAKQLIHSLQQGIVEFPSKLFFHRLCSVPRKTNKNMHKTGESRTKTV